MLDKLDAIKGRFDNLGVALTNPEIVSDNKKFTAISKEYRSLEKIVLARDAYVRLLDDIEFNKDIAVPNNAFGTICCGIDLKLLRLSSTF